MISSRKLSDMDKHKYLLQQMYLLDDLMSITSNTSLTSISLTHPKITYVVLVVLDNDYNTLPYGGFNKCNTLIKVLTFDDKANTDINVNKDNI